MDAVVSMVGIAGDALTLLFLLTAFRYGGEAGPLAMVGLGSGLVFTGLAVEFNSAAKYGFASAQACRRAHAPAVRRPAPPVR